MLIISFALTFFGEIESVMSPRRYVQQLEVLKFMLRHDSKKDNKKKRTPKSQSETVIQRSRF